MAPGGSLLTPGYFHCFTRELKNGDITILSFLFNLLDELILQIGTPPINSLLALDYNSHSKVKINA